MIIFPEVNTLPSLVVTSFAKVELCFYQFVKLPMRGHVKLRAGAFRKPSSNGQVW